MPIVKGQKSLLVATIPQPKIVCVDHELMVRTKRLRVSELYKTLISFFIYEESNKEKYETVKEMLGITYMKILDLREMKLLRKPSEDVLSMEKLIITKILKEQKSNVKFFLNFITSQKLVQELYFVNGNEYYGKITNLKPLELVFVRRTVRKHQQKFVGVGYKDKGSAKKLNIDGSPSWQEIAQYGDRVDEITRYTNARRTKNYKILDTTKVSILSSQKSIFNHPTKLHFIRREISFNSGSDFASLIYLDKSPFRANEWRINQEEVDNIIYDHFRSNKMTISPIDLGGRRGYLLKEATS